MDPRHHDRYDGLPSRPRARPGEGRQGALGAAYRRGTASEVGTGRAAGKRSWGLAGQGVRFPARRANRPHARAAGRPTWSARTRSTATSWTRHQIRSPTRPAETHPGSLRQLLSEGDLAGVAGGDGCELGWGTHWPEDGAPGA